MSVRRRGEYRGTGLLRRQTVERYAGLVAAREPEPGGGSVAACVVALAASCVEKASAYTLGNERYRAGWERARRAIAAARDARRRALRLVDEDARAYRRVAKARLLLRRTTFQRKNRRDIVRAAQRYADRVLYDIVAVAASVVRTAAALAGRSNPLLDGDLRCAVRCATAAAAAAADLISAGACSSLRSGMRRTLERMHTDRSTIVEHRE